MNGVKIEYIDPTTGDILPHWDEASNIYYTNNTLETETVKDALDYLFEHGVGGHTPEITIGENGNWFVDGVDTGTEARGPRGYEGEGGGLSINGGTFQEALTFVEDNDYQDRIFAWLLEDEDTDGNPVKIVIWHTLDDTFINAFGEEIIGDSSDITTE